ncbi:MAG: Na+/H+ antiporter NhaC family protein [Phycisphaerae bacterium]
MIPKLFDPRRPKRFSRPTWVMVAITACGMAHAGLAQTNEAPSDSNHIQDTTATPSPEDHPVVETPQSYNLWVLAPAVVAIGLAVFTRQVVPALVAGVVVGAFMLLPYQSGAGPYCDGHTIINGLRLAFEKYLIGSIHEISATKTVDPDAAAFGHIKIIIFTLVIGFTVGVIGRNGGTAGMVHLVAGRSNSPRRGTLTAWLAGMVVFFDDYANTMIVGPTMRPIFDRLRISRAKLAYIVDSTAAPVASLAVIGTWVGAEIGYIDQGIQQVAQAGMPAFLLDSGGHPLSGMTLFLSSLPYRFYPLLALFLVFLVSMTGRDFGPMRKAQERAFAGEEETTDRRESLSTEDEPPPSWWLGLAPVVILVLVTLAVLAATGLQQVGGWAALPAHQELWKKVSEVIGNADAYLCIYYGAIASAVVAVGLTALARTCSMKEAVDAGLEGMARMFPAIVILVLAWSLSQVEQDLQLGAVVSSKLQHMGFGAAYMPLAVFLAAAGISFATGTSWATMGLLCPITVSITVSLCVKAGLDPEHARTLLYAAVGSVLAGSIFGDHCSPISDTTVLSSIAAGCRHESHVWTQMPYALVVAAVSTLAGEGLCSALGQPWYVGLAAGAAVLIILVFALGRSLDYSNPLSRTNPLAGVASRMARNRPRT